MTRAELVTFLRTHRVAVVSTVSPSGAPESALVGFAVSDALELVFDTLSTTRKAHNLRANPRVAIVIGGWGAHEVTAQLEGLADERVGDRLREVYYAAYPDGRERAAWPGLVYVRVRVTWARFSDFAAQPPRIELVE
ncbi:MAG TPA: pyridoxamine 5'-phosphate oxidase family protein [Kofleriaceae bacterium]